MKTELKIGDMHLIKTGFSLAVKNVSLCLSILFVHLCASHYAFVCVHVCVREGRTWLSDCLSITTDTSSLLEGKHLDISAWPYSCPAWDGLSPCVGPSADSCAGRGCVCACLGVCACVFMHIRQLETMWGPVGQWFWNLFHPQVTVKLSEKQVCSSSRCISPCLYLQLFSPLSANILLTMLYTESPDR